MNRVIRLVDKILEWQSVRLPAVRWLIGLGLLVVPFGCRVLFGSLHGMNPAMISYPFFLLGVLILETGEAIALSLVFIGVAWFLFARSGNYLAPLGWLLVSGLTIAIMNTMKRLARALKAANERQRLLFEELQHRVANSLQAASGTLELARRRLESSPAQAAQLLAEGSERLAAAAAIHRRLHDPSLFQHGLAPILQDAVASVIDVGSVAVGLDIEPMALNYDQMSILTMLVIEMANNAQKHVFQYGLGTRFTLALKAVAGGRAALTMSDDGPGLTNMTEAAPGANQLGVRITQQLTAQLGGTWTVIPGVGTTVMVEFPVRAPGVRQGDLERARKRRDAVRETAAA